MGFFNVSNFLLYVIDGIFMCLGFINMMSLDVGFDIMLIINSFDIENIIIIKDVVVVFFYGLCVVNGVVFIIIKKGKSGKL